MLDITLPWESSGWLAAFRFCSYSSTRFRGKRSNPVLSWLSRIKSAYSKPDRKCGFGFLLESRKVALVMPLEAMAQSGTLGRLKPVAQPGPSPEIGMGGFPLAVAWVAKAEACSSASAKCQSSRVNDGVVDSGPNCSLADTFPPTTKESSPFVSL